MEETSTKKRGQYATKKKKELENLLSAAKDFKFEHSRKKDNGKRTPATIAEFTKDSCMYPATYLDNDNTCVDCDIYEHCACKIKTLGKKKRNE